jgi:hypothetical protein
LLLTTTSEGLETWFKVQSTCLTIIKPGVKTLALPKKTLSWSQWYMPVIPALRRLRPEDCVFEASLSKTKQNKRMGM